ncbi:hypothetical protein [Klebsiella michiganensis]|uniref:Uncharacterized protein n=1 Tax=Klebsiella michiganensis TaxID=1134687 RepID=A0A2J4R7T0_9ENTR|nr:hypothetical protein [Klebsiella michiganensis]MCY3512022.1 hypothetical protein [Klebsiella michiganensis]MDL4446154.1 hypothetical protein [Klebsiella michiganensis]MDL4491050.1 hypothetical protein [Klebsiella michiganensis]MDL4659793.1 hypothetical protein [Klebsiella michiganensis]PLL39386.1 hypothetical protein CWN50_13860 [Klebsiella michiganensis]
MTNNQLTDAQISNATLIRLILWADEHNSHYVAAALRELQERRKAAMDSEPVAYTDEAELCFVNDMACMWTKGMGINEVPLYRHAQPAPVVMDGYVMVPKEPTAEMQSAGASAIRIETTALNKLWTGNAVFRAMLAAAPQEDE